MAGIAVALFAYSLSGVAAVIDKILLTKRIPSAPAYAFLVGILGLFALMLAPFGLTLLPPLDMAVSLTSGALFIFALLLMYEAIQRADVSRVTPMIGSLTPVFMIGFSWLGYGDAITVLQGIAIALFVAGGLFLAPRAEHSGIRMSAAVLSAVSSALLALSFLLLGEAFKNSPFIPVFIWSRLGSAGTAAFFLLVPAVRHAVLQMARATNSTSSILFFFNKGIGALSFFLLNYAIALGPLSVVAALKGTEYIAVFLLVMLLTSVAPHELREISDRRGILLKLAGIALIGIGFIVLARA